MLIFTSFIAHWGVFLKISDNEVFISKNERYYIIKVQNNSPITNYVGHQLKLDGFFSEPLVDVIRKDNTDDECVNLLSVDCKDLIVDY